LVPCELLFACFAEVKNACWRDLTDMLEEAHALEELDGCFSFNIDTTFMGGFLIDL